MMQEGAEKAFILKEKEAPVRKEGEALLQINKVGICGTDLHAYAGNQAFFTIFTAISRLAS